MPNHVAAQKICDDASIDCAAISEKGFGKICAASPLATRWNPSEQVPRMPSVSQTEVRSIVRFSSAGMTTITWSELAASGARRAVARMASA